MPSSVFRKMNSLTPPCSLPESLTWELLCIEPSPPDGVRMVVLSVSPIGLFRLLHNDMYLLMSHRQIQMPPLHKPIANHKVLQCASVSVKHRAVNHLHICTRDRVCLLDLMSRHYEKTIFNTSYKSFTSAMLFLNDIDF